MENSIKNQAINDDLITSLQAENAALRSENEELKSNLQKLALELAKANQIIAELQEQFKLSIARQFGKKTEASKQLPLDQVFDEELESLEAREEVSNGNDQPLESLPEVKQPASRQSKATGRKINTSKLPCKEITYDLSEPERQCSCGHHLVLMGSETTEQLEYIPAVLQVVKSTVMKYVCKHCETIKAAIKPEAPIAKCMAMPSLISEVIIKKYEHHLPWYRQSKIFAQQGVDLPANTICNWFMRAGEVLEPLKQALVTQLATTHVLQADETPVKMLQDNIKGYMWCYHSLEPNNHFLLFEYNDSRSGTVVNTTLQHYQGILQTDGYGGYNQLRVAPNIIHLGCWAHARRKFAEVVKISKTAGKAHEVVKWIGKLYDIERRAKETKLSCIERQALRQAEAPPILAKIKELIDRAKPAPKSAIGQAITYLQNQWESLIRYVSHGQAEIDNNLCENQIRPFAIGKKNWMFLGNQRSARIAAFFYSIIQTCRLNNIDPNNYLIYVLSQAGKMRRKEISPVSLLPQFIDKALLK